MKTIGQHRTAYIRASDAFCKVNREVGGCLEALHKAMTKRDAMKPKYYKVKDGLDRALMRESRRRNRRH